MPSSPSPRHGTPRHGVFVGLTTLDFEYLIDGMPTANQKIVAADHALAAGGPATNAAIAFSYLGNRATLASVIGSHPLNTLIHSDLTSHGVAIADLAPDHSQPLPVSSILVTAVTGERAVVSLNAVRSQVKPNQIPVDLSALVAMAHVVLVDGHQMQVGAVVAELAQQRGIPVVVDCGSWKPGFATVLVHTDYAICSANFRPPDCQTPEEIFAYLRKLGIPHVAITHGEAPIRYAINRQGVTGEVTRSGWVAVPQVSVVDTLGAGDVFHGAFCHYILQDGLSEGFELALAKAGVIAAHACKSFGTRRWLDQPIQEDPACCALVRQD